MKKLEKFAIEEMNEEDKVDEVIKLRKKISRQLKIISELEKNISLEKGLKNGECEVCGKNPNYAIKYGCTVGFSIPEINNCPYEKLDEDYNPVWTYSIENPSKPK